MATATLPAVPDASSDPVVQQFREQISDLDLAILDALNKRLSLVQKLHAYKRAHDYDLHDATREDWALAYIARANRGPLDAAALREFLAAPDRSDDVRGRTPQRRHGHLASLARRGPVRGSA